MQDMSPEHVAAGDTALLQALSPAIATEHLLAVALVTPDGVQSVQRIRSPIVVGRDASCDLVLPDRAASRHHARLTPCPNGIEVVDLDSRNGTFVGGRTARRVTAPVGSTIRIGSVLLLVAQLEEEWRLPELAGPLVGGHSLAAVRRTVSLVGPTELPILILGDTGTGKEVVARLVHTASARSGPFVAVNCAALPEHLVESELFGHVRGAFTGADRNRQGLLTMASSGTLFLDELGELPLPAQAKLLRVLEDRMVRSVGAERASRIDVRFLSATNANLRAAVDAGRFRADLYARLAAVEIRLPALRQRREDIPALIEFLLARAGRGPLRFSIDALEALLVHGWPHNIRELDNLVRTVALRGSSIDLDDLPLHLQAQLREARREIPSSAPLPSADDELRGRIVDLLDFHRGNVRRVAISLGMARGQLYRLLKRFALAPDSFRTHGPNDADGPKESP